MHEESPDTKAVPGTASRSQAPGGDEASSLAAALSERDEAIDRDTDRARGQIDDWAYCIDGQRPFVQ